MAKEKAGRPRVLIRRHVLEIKEDTQDWIEDTIDRFTEQRTFGKNSRIVGASITAVGVYTMVRIVGLFGRDVGEAVKEAFTGGPLPTGGQPGLSAINYFIRLFSAPPKDEDAMEDTTFLEDLGQFDPFAFGAALMAGGMVLAGLNPGEILKGVGKIIDGLVPL